MNRDIFTTNPFNILTQSDTDTDSDSYSNSYSDSIDIDESVEDENSVHSDRSECSECGRDFTYSDSDINLDYAYKCCKCTYPICSSCYSALDTNEQCITCNSYLCDDCNYSDRESCEFCNSLLCNACILPERPERCIRCNKEKYTCQQCNYVFSICIDCL